MRMDNESLNCPSCGYELTALTKARCPECGKPFEVCKPNVLINRKKVWWRAYLIGATSVPVLYLALYLLLRVGGVYYPYYSQGSWEMDGGTNIYFVDLAYLPLIFVENEFQAHFDWFYEQPTGG